jgi:hypothetical protein
VICAAFQLRVHRPGPVLLVRADWHAARAAAGAWNAPAARDRQQRILYSVIAQRRFDRIGLAIEIRDCPQAEMVLLAPRLDAVC